jgi:hypothetical protein
MQMVKNGNIREKQLQIYLMLQALEIFSQSMYTAYEIGFMHLSFFSFYFSFFFFFKKRVFVDQLKIMSDVLDQKENQIVDLHEMFYKFTLDSFIW